ncbi:unnamed protein product [Protopolystoma xenopodis]|uniref:Uncharacterized protein n=1 Tax=Protopolystoma xenopodis TaxID=117903 RepID=A0A448WYF9_9PLAT|nr:unnamed protein product [Protopolystoma xenopodis]
MIIANPWRELRLSTKPLRYLLVPKQGMQILDEMVTRLSLLVRLIFHHSHTLSGMLKATTFHITQLPHFDARCS